MSDTNKQPPIPPSKANNSQSVPIAVPAPTIAQVPHSNATVFPNNDIHSVFKCSCYLALDFLNLRSYFRIQGSKRILFQKN